VKSADYLAAAARAAAEQLADNALLAVPLDPDVADFMGAFFEDALSLAKEQAKKLGAKWDKEVKSWFVPEGTDLVKLREWMPVEAARAFAWHGTDMPDRDGFFSPHTVSYF
jgi:hypothetical protein